MSLNEDIPQANPETLDVRLEELRDKANRVVTVLEDNKGAISRWFWKGLLAFNLTLASVVLWAIVVPHLVQFL